MTNFSGHYFRHYYLQKRIGSGGYADVYEALDIFLNGNVAVKVLKVQVDPNDLQAVLQNAREARIAASLVHPHIVSVIEFDIHNNIPFIVMEYAKNGSLRRIHHAGEPLLWETIIHYVQQVTEALTFIHNHGIIHQDVKPENMLLDNNHEILVSDFGTVAFIQNTGPQNVQGCIRKNRLAIRFALVLPVAAAFIGLLLHSWLSFWWALPILLIVSSIVGLLRGFRS